MSFLPRSTRYARALRVLLVVLACTLVLNGVGYLTHHHSLEKASGASTHSSLCSYCAAFGSLGGAPVVALTAATVPSAGLIVAWFVSTPRLRRRASASRPRAPPAR